MMAEPREQSLLIDEARVALLKAIASVEGCNNPAAEERLRDALRLVSRAAEAVE
jgi:hypothetical protein